MNCECHLSTRQVESCLGLAWSASLNKPRFLVGDSGDREGEPRDSSGILALQARLAHGVLLRASESL